MNNKHNVFVLHMADNVFIRKWQEWGRWPLQEQSYSLWHQFLADQKSCLSLISKISQTLSYSKNFHFLIATYVMYSTTVTSLVETK